MDELEPIPACLPLAKSFAEIRRAMRTSPLNSSEIHKIVTRARIEAESCCDACKSSFLSGRKVFSGGVEYRSIQEIEGRYAERLEVLDGYKRITLQPSFSQVAGEALDNHEHDVLNLSASWQEKYIQDRHTIRDHVGHNQAGLEQMFRNKPNEFASSFTDKRTAEWAIATTMVFYQHLIIRWLSTNFNSQNWWDRNVLRLPTDFDLGRKIGMVLTISEDECMGAFSAQIVLVRDTTAPKRFYVKTAYPTNSPIKI